MNALSKILAIMLLALWVPATTHCDLEAAGLITAHIDSHENVSCCESHEPCSSENCPVAEGGIYKPSGTWVKVSSPSLLACVFSLCLQPSTLDAWNEPVTPVVVIENALSWVPTRHFVRGAAPLSRAPSVLA